MVETCPVKNDRRWVPELDIGVILVTHLLEEGGPLNFFFNGTNSFSLKDCYWIERLIKILFLWNLHEILVSLDTFQGYLDIVHFLFFFKFVYFETVRERENEWERGGERECQAGSAPSAWSPTWSSIPAETP